MQWVFVIHAISGQIYYWNLMENLCVMNVGQLPDNKRIKLLKKDRIFSNN
jgi:hypothetical protein